MRGYLGALIGPWSLEPACGPSQRSYDTGNRLTVAECTLYWGGLSPGRELVLAPGWSPMGGNYMHNRVVSMNSAWFPKWECRVDTLTTLHLRVESGACIILCSLDWIHAWMMSNCWIWMMSNRRMWTMNNCSMWLLDNECCVSSWCLLTFSC